MQFTPLHILDAQPHNNENQNYRALVIRQEEVEAYPRCEFCYEEYPKDIIVRTIVNFMYAQEEHIEQCEAKKSLVAIQAEERKLQITDAIHISCVQCGEF